MLTNIRIALLLILGSAQLHAATTQDTVRVFQYNLLTYGDANNPEAYKNQRLTTIVNYAHPDIVGVNELSNGASYAQSVLTNVLGNGWEKGNYSNTNNQIQTNMLFWKTAKFGLARQTVVTHIVRDIIAFRLYYKDGGLAAHDTSFLTIIVGHLKAGTASSDSVTRANETQAVATYLNNAGAGNYIFMGDMNLYSGNEQAYLNVTTGNTNMNGRLYDPINRPGNWHSNSSFADIHTQATRTTTLPDGGVGGGLDDRFDHMLASGYIMNNTGRMRYLSGTYKAIGQDGQHFNKSVNSPANIAVPSAVADALYEMSDHLPITADFAITRTEMPSGIAQLNKEMNDGIHIQNPVHYELRIRFDDRLTGRRYTCRMYNSVGQLTDAWMMMADEESHPLQHMLTPGMYTLRISDEQGNTIFKKLLVN